jgi:hypothetical protein
MPFISVTRLRLRSWVYLPPFIVQAFRAIRQAANAEGNLAVATLRDRRNTFWTTTSWSSEDSMKAFMRSGAHAAAMKKLLNWCDEATLAHWTQDDANLPTWDQAHARIQREGRQSKVNYPSAAHTANRIPPPVSGRNRETRAK